MARKAKAAASATALSKVQPQKAAVEHALDASQTLRASTALLRKMNEDEIARATSSGKVDLLADAGDDSDEAASATAPVWLILTTKKHVVDKKRLKPGKIALPHPYIQTSDENLRICLITADPQRKYKDLIAEPSFPLDISSKIGRVIGITKLKAKYKSFESRRQLFGEYDVFLADDRVITYLPQTLGKVFYKGGSKRPIPLSFEGRRQNFDEEGNKRRKLSEGGVKAVKTAVQPAEVARSIERTLGSTLVHLAPSTTTAVKVGTAAMTPAQLQANIDAVVADLIDRYVPQKWNNVRAVHIKGPNTVALPIWLTDELWTDEQDVLDEAPPVKEGKKRKRGALSAADSDAVIEIPGPDGQIRRLEKPAEKREFSPRKLRSASGPAAAKKQNGTATALDEVALKESEAAERAARKSALKSQKSALKAGKAAALKVT